MFNHALKLIWNRRRANALVIAEVAAAFVVAFVLLALLVDLWSNYRRPLGFVYDDVWRVNLQGDNAVSFVPFASVDGVDRTLEDVRDALRRLPAVVSAEPIFLTPFLDFTWNGAFGPDADSSIPSRLNRLTAEGLAALGVATIDGRLFGAADEGQDYRPVVVNRTFAERAFGRDDSPLGRRINHPDPDAAYFAAVPEESRSEAQREALRELRVVGIIEDFRMHGEFSAEVPFVITRYEPRDARQFSSFDLMVKVAPGTDAALEEDIVRTAESVAPGWVASVVPWERLRATRHAETLLPFKAGVTIAAFFLVLVVMGLIGVLWQDVVRRTQEIGLRRAVGARAAAVRRQIQLEMLVVGILGVAIGTAVAIQFPLLELVQRIDWGAALPGLALSTALILGLTLLGALYPSWLAARREPADALRYE